MRLPVGRRPPRPNLEFLALGAAATVLALAGATTLGLVSSHVRVAALGALANADRALVLGLVAPRLEASDLVARGDMSRVAAIETDLRMVAGRAGLDGLRVLSPRGEPLYSTEPADRSLPPIDGLARAVSGEASVAVVGVPSTATAPPREVVSELIPVLDGQRIVGIVEVQRDAAFLGPYLIAAQRDTILAAFAVVVVLLPFLALIYRAAHRRIRVQAEMLLVRWRLDPLTRLANHGDSVERLTAEVDRGRRAAQSVAVALVDIDNFRQLNEIHGHDAGDRALRTLSRLLSTLLPSTCTIGRYGPDEFIVFTRPATTSDLWAALTAIRDRLSTVNFPGRSRERLPISLSVGISAYPLNGDTAAQVLSEAVTALAAARSSGGDDVRIAEVAMADQPPVRYNSFNVLRGLVHAVDTKDRYTRRHSEDVSRYAMFLGSLLELDDTTLRAIRLSGLLHDIGKIGIPDEILRKPGPLTSQEQEIVRQHVRLGDLIVRDVPDLVAVRAGVRHHHERWDGGGYLDRLAGERIPLIARILAVADAFSAMTTTRPYRKALPMSEALRRIEDGAGSQFEPVLVTRFVQGMTTAADAPRPDEPRRGQRLWAPAGAVM